MTLIELKELVDKTLQYNPGNKDLEVVVVTNDSSIGGSACTKLKAIGEGFDWESGRLNLYTEKDLYKSPKITSRFTKSEIKSVLKKDKPEAILSMKGRLTYLYKVHTPYYDVHFSVPIKDMGDVLFSETEPSVKLLDWML